MCRRRSQFDGEGERGFLPGGQAGEWTGKLRLAESRPLVAVQDHRTAAVRILPLGVHGWVDRRQAVGAIRFGQSNLPGKKTDFENLLLFERMIQIEADLPWPIRQAGSDGGAP